MDPAALYRSKYNTDGTRIATTTSTPKAPVMTGMPKRTLQTSSTPRNEAQASYLPAYNKNDSKYKFNSQGAPVKGNFWEGTPRQGRVKGDAHAERKKSRLDFEGKDKGFSGAYVKQSLKNIGNKIKSKIPQSIKNVGTKISSGAKSAFKSIGKMFSRGGKGRRAKKGTKRLRRKRFFK